MLIDIVNRTHLVENWQKIPWDDPAFSQRMLTEHLSQAHDAASRRAGIIDEHVAWIHETILQGRTASVLDLGCGPGLYTARLTALGHRCTGIDFSPASVAYAREHSACSYLQADIRQAAFGNDYDLVMLLFGEFNAFSPVEAAHIVDKAYDALKPGGLLLLEPHTYEAIVQLGNEPAQWYSTTAGLFSDQPHLCLSESRFEAENAVEHFYVVDATTGGVSTYVNMLHAYTEQGYREILGRFADVTIYPEFANRDDNHRFLAITARKAG